MTQSDGWKTVEHYVKQATIEHIMEAETVGYFVYENEDIVMLAQTLDIGNAMMLNAQVIAKDCIIDNQLVAFVSANWDRAREQIKALPTEWLNGVDCVMVNHVIDILDELE